MQQAILTFCSTSVHILTLGKKARLSVVTKFSLFALVCIPSSQPGWGATTPLIRCVDRRIYKGKVEVVIISP